MGYFICVYTMVKVAKAPDRVLSCGLYDSVVRDALDVVLRVNFAKWVAQCSILGATANTEKCR